MIKIVVRIEILKDKITGHDKTLNYFFQFILLKIHISKHILSDYNLV